MEEGINEAGAISSFIAAGVSYSTHGIKMIPFYIYYSMFGFQRVWDFIWAAGDMRARGFLLGGTAGRTTLNGEGLQHQDGHSHLAAAATPNIKAYDLAYAYEIAIVIHRGMKEMCQDEKDVIYYLTLENENYAHPPAPEGVADDIIKGTKVDGVYSGDPELDPDATKYDTISFKEVIEKELGVMDLTAITLCKENNLPIIVFDIKSKNGLVDIVNSIPTGTTVS